jgi:hypothetical protein
MGHLNKLDWEKLARNLQEALSKEMKENERLGKEIEGLNERLERAGRVIDRVQAEGLDHFSGVTNKQAVICYLENRLYEEMAKNRRIQEDEIPF